MTPWLGRIKILRLAGVILAAGILVWSGCGSSPRVQEKPAGDESLERLNRAARQAFDRGRFEQAASIYRKALERALVRDDTNAIVNAQYNLAVCLMKLDNHAEALQLISQAEAELTLSDQSRLPDLLLLKALLYYKSARQDDAWETTHQILSMTHQTTPDIRSRTHFLRGLIASERGDIQQLRDEMTALGKPRNLILRGDLLELQGHLAMAELKWEAAVNSFDEAVSLRRETLDYPAMAKALALAAGACKKAGKTKAASQRFLRAGRSAVLQTDYDTALIWLNQAEQLATEAGDDQIAREARLYLEQVQKAEPAVQ
jgi:tetratricopeptide (TPR) repeat protein